MLAPLTPYIHSFPLLALAQVTLWLARHACHLEYSDKGECRTHLNEKGQQPDLPPPMLLCVLATAEEGA